MRERGPGTIVNVSSVAGRFAALAQAVYASSKWALECLSENLAQELAPFGIRVKVIEPGVTRTALLAKHQDLHADSPYADAYRRMFAFYATGIEANVRPSVVAEVVQQAIDDPSARLRYAVRLRRRAAGRRPRRRQRRASGWRSARAANDDEYFDRFERVRSVSTSAPATSAPTSRRPSAAEDEGERMSLRGRLLVAEPTMDDPNFRRTVVYLIEHSADGALGLVLNRPGEVAGA